MILRPDKKFVPFNTLAEYQMWMSDNCYDCKKCEDESETLEEARCKLAFIIEHSQSNDGTIPFDIAERIGINSNLCRWK